MSNSDLNAPLDMCHRISLYLTGKVNDEADAIRERIAVWTPRPLDPDWDPYDDFG